MTQQLYLHIPGQWRSELSKALENRFSQDPAELPVALQSPAAMALHCALGAEEREVKLIEAPEEITAHGALVMVDAPDFTGMHPETASFLRSMTRCCRSDLRDTQSIPREKRPVWYGAPAALLSFSSETLGTKRSAQDILFSLNTCGWAIPGKALVETVDQAYNMRTRAAVNEIDAARALSLSCAELGERVTRLSPDTSDAPSRLTIAAIHSSTSSRSNTLALWKAVGQELESRVHEQISISTLTLDSTAIDDCRGCAFHTCRHFGQKGGCFYGGRITEETFPAIQEAHVLVLLLPNYNDSPPANFLALFNRLTALYHADSSGFIDKTLCLVTVSGYSGSDCVIKTALSGLCLNKGFSLMPEASLHALANSPGEIENSWSTADFQAARDFAGRIVEFGRE